MVKIQGNCVFQTGNKCFHIVRMQVNSAQFMSIAEDDVGRRRILALASKSVLLFFITRKTGAMVFGFDRSVDNQII